MGKDDSSMMPLLTRLSSYRVLKNTHNNESLVRPSLGTHCVTSRRFIDTFTEGEGRFMHSQSGLVICGGVWKLEEHEEKTIGCFTFPAPSDTSTSIWERSHTLAKQRWTHSCTELYCTVQHCTVL